MGNRKNQIPGNLLPFIQTEIEKLISLGVIVESNHEKGEVVSPIFVREKSDGSYRIILNLKKFNEFVTYDHFKMENLFSATDMMKEGCFLASVDLRHAYYSVPVDIEYQKFLKFQWDGKLFQYTCFPNGLSNCPRDFTKLLKPVYANLRGKGHLSSAFIDDCCLQGASYVECKRNVEDTVKLFESLGFVIHKDKSVFEPCQRIKYLGFWLDSIKMTITLTEEKIDKVKKACSRLKDTRKITIRTLAQVIGKLVSCFPAVQYGRLFYRDLERLKTKALKENKGNFDKMTELDKKSIKELDWWIDNIESSYSPVKLSQPEIEIKTDASKLGYGSFCDEEKAGGRWNKEEKLLHINILELKAIENALQSFEDKITGKHVKIFSDNSVAVCYIREMGGKTLDCNEIAKRIWLWCISRNIFLSITFLPGILNSEADEKSRIFNDRTEWMLNQKIFDKLTNMAGTPDIDLFASRLNYKLKPFVSWGRDPESFAVNAFLLNWSNWNFIYAFPPFSIILKVLRKWSDDGAEGILICPLWKTATWFPVLLRMLVAPPILLNRGKSTLVLPHSGESHPLYQKLTLTACVLSGKHYKCQNFLKKLAISSSEAGENQPKNSIKYTSKSTMFSVLNGIEIPCNHLN